MSNKYLTEDVRKKYKNEFCKFLTQIIKYASGSLQFSQLSLFLQQARFEIRDAFGTTKGELMKFLKKHPEIFQIDNKSIVTFTDVSSDPDSVDFFAPDKNSNTESKKLLPKKIKNGTGLVVKFHTAFGIIAATEPIKTVVHFRSSACTDIKDSHFIECNLEIRDEVYFDAVYVNDDYDIEFHATKVWRKLDEMSANKRCEEAFTSNLEGEVVIKKLFKAGDHVEFSANRSNKKYSEDQWQSKIVRKGSKNDFKQSSCSEAKMTNVISVKKKIENEKGKICPHSHGAIIKFGKDYSELADGDSNSTKYFFLGSEVADIKWEFSEGDDVLFDAVRTKSAPGWKALLVWVGEKPVYINNKGFSDEEVNEFCESKTYAPSSGISLASYSSSIKSKCNVSPAEHIIEPSKELFDPSVNRKVNELDDHKKQIIKKSKQIIKKSSKSPQNLSVTKSRSTEVWSEPDKGNSCVDKHKNGQYRAISEQVVMYETKRKHSLKNKHTDASRYRTAKELDEISTLTDEDCEGHLSSKDNLSDSEDSLQSDIRVQSMLNNDKYLVKENLYDESFVHASKYEFTSSSDGISNRNEIKCHKDNSKGKSSIKTFEDIDGEIVDLYCKAAIIKSSHLQKEVDFVLNAFYLNGKSVEEEQVIDLKEIIKVGDNVKFNCFEIIDDFGVINQKVTIAWKGPKPKVIEITPEDFINDHELSVTLREELHSGCIQEHRADQLNFLLTEPNSEETCEVISSTKYSAVDISDDEIIRHSIEPTTEICENFHELSSDKYNRLLSEMIIQKLKRKGLISLNSEVDFSSVLNNVINIVLKHCSTYICNTVAVNETLEEGSNVAHSLCFNCAEMKSKIFSTKSKNVKHAEVQTIITGGIIAQSIYTKN